MQLETVIYEVNDSVGVITLNRPEAANAQKKQIEIPRSK
jgi:enoyl-CoA hydratase/carnithine racemase